MRVKHTKQSGSKRARGFEISRSLAKQGITVVVVDSNKTRGTQAATVKNSHASSRPVTQLLSDLRSTSFSEDDQTAADSDRNGFRAA